MRGFLVGRAERALGLAFALAAACGGKAEKDGFEAESPSAGNTGAPNASGGSAGMAVSATGGVAASSGGGMTLPAVGGFATGGRLSHAGSGGVDAGGAAPATGGAAARPEPGTEIWFPRGYLSLENMYPELVSKLLGTAPPTQTYFAQSWGFVNQSPIMAINTQLVAWVRETLTSLEDDALLDALGCETADAACAESTVSVWARRIWRRTLDESESQTLLQVFSDEDLGSEMTALREIVRRVLSEPFAYIMPTLGTEVETGKYRLSDVELAGLLAITITGMPPESELLDRAYDGDFDLEREVDRLLATDAARERLNRMIRRWFRVPDAGLLWLSDEEPALAESMLEETRLFIDEIAFEEPAPVQALLTADHSYADGLLASIYGLDLPADAGFERVDLRDTRRRGIPGQASYLTATSRDDWSSYALRGTYPLSLVCEQLPPPPAAVDTVLPPSTGPKPRRALIQEMTSAPSCAGCHRVMDPIAFAFDHFNGRGTYVDVDPHGFTIDSTGSLTTFAGLSFEFKDSLELTQQIADSPAYSRCFVKSTVQWLVGSDPNGVALDDYVDRAHEPGADEYVLAAVREFLLSDHFVYRKD